MILFLKNLFLGGKKEVILFSDQLASLLAGGVPMLKALDVYLEQAQNKHFQAVILQIKEGIKNGQPFSWGINRHPSVFSSFYQAMVKTGENSGSLDESLKLIADYYREEEELVSKIKSALAYPFLILAAGFLTLFFIFFHVMPRVIPVFDALDIEKPFATRALINTSIFFQENWFWFFLGIFIFILVLARAMKSPAFLFYLSTFRLKIPVVGLLSFKSDVARFSRALSIALRKGVSVMSAVRAAVPILSEYRLRQRLEGVCQGLASGSSVKDVFAKTKVFPSFVISLINMGQESGRLAKAFADIADSYERDCRELIRILTNLLEPVLVLAVGLFVGFIVAAVLAPILDLSFVQL